MPRNDCRSLAPSWCLTLALAWWLSACAEQRPVDHAMPADEALSVVSGGVTCGATLERYPVAGPHNGGYDKNALTYTCAPHPGSSPDNSDFIGGDHYGNDIFGAKGTPIVAPRTGTVVKAGFINIGGNRVTIQDACGWQYYHAHLDTIAPGIVVGKKVNAGELIGTLGKTGNAQGTSPHLHFSIYPDGNYEKGIDPFPLLKAVDGTSCGACKPHCEGSVIVGADCGKGDCGAYGSKCVDDALGVRCVFYACPATGSVKVCVDDSKIGQCNNGAIDIGDCGAYGAYCSTAGASEARCVSAFCVPTPQTVPWAHDICFLDGDRYHCDANGGFTKKPCGAGSHCSAVPDVHCASGGCPASGTGDACLGDNLIVKCADGKVVEQGDCGAYGAYCSTAGGTAPHCVSAFCVDSPKSAPVAHDICFMDGDRYHCDAQGGITKKPCGDGEFCVSEPSAHCEPPCAPGPESCNGKDDDCDGEVDEGFGAGQPCSVGEGACATTGTVVCTDGGGAQCSAVPAVCDDFDPCTTDACDVTVGCVFGAVPGCCSAGVPCPTGQVCADGACKDTCGPGEWTTCNGSTLELRDGCGARLSVIEHCERGCVGGACCPVGTRVLGDACVDDGPGGPGPGPGDDAGGVDADADSGGASGDADPEDVQSGAADGVAIGAFDVGGWSSAADGSASGDGCSTGGARGGLPVLAALLGLLMMRRRRTS